MFDYDDFIAETIKDLKEKIKGKAIIACSGGVDSTVAALLVNEAIGKRLLTVYVDTGLMREGETEEVNSLFKELKLNFKIIMAKDKFLSRLKGVSDPEEKRKIIGKTFIDVFEEEAEKFGAEYLVQGTIAPDWIESGGGLRDTIKSHHNVGGLPETMNIKLIEPLRDLYKDEIRKVAYALDIRVKERQPFPGPALAIRILGEITEEKVDIIRGINAIFEEEIDKAVKNKEIDFPWQYFAVLIPIKSVGVHGDQRAYGYTIALRAVESIDGMTAAYFKIPHTVLDRISIRITNTYKKVNRIVYDITNKPPATIEWE